MNPSAKLAISARLVEGESETVKRPELPTVDPRDRAQLEERFCAGRACGGDRHRLLGDRTRLGRAASCVQGGSLAA